MLKETHYWAEIRGDDSLLNSFSLGPSFSLPFVFFVSFNPFFFLPLLPFLSLLESDLTLMKFTFGHSWQCYRPDSSVCLLSLFS